MAKVAYSIKNLDEVPAILQAKDVATLLGISMPVTYDLLQSEGFPTVRIGEKRMVVPKDALINWLQLQAGR